MYNPGYPGFAPPDPFARVRLGAILIALGLTVDLSTDCFYALSRWAYVGSSGIYGALWSAMFLPELAALILIGVGAAMLTPVPAFGAQATAWLTIAAAVVSGLLNLASRFVGLSGQSVGGALLLLGYMSLYGCLAATGALVAKAANVRVGAASIAIVGSLVGIHALSWLLRLVVATPLAFYVADVSAPPMAGALAVLFFELRVAGHPPPTW
ncbi:hypothetical protein BH09MYX1_BH09MYX1_28900 [soil metagenome]